MGKKILAIGGHIGDMELTCGGILAECVLKGGEIVTLALTAGEKGAPKDASIIQYREQKVMEAEAFAQTLGGKACVLAYEDGALPDSETVRFEVCDIIRREKPDMILTHYQGSMHKDHTACSRIVQDAWYYAAIRGFEREFPPHFGQLYFAENWEDKRGFTPYYYFGFGEEAFQLWQKAMKTHAFVTGGSFPYLEYYSHLKRIRGIEARKPYAECFMSQPEDYKVIREL